MSNRFDGRGAWRPAGKYTGLAWICWAGMLQGCALLEPPKPVVVATPPQPAAVVLQRAEETAYNEGFMQGRRVQWRRDRAVAMAKAAKDQNGQQATPPGQAGQVDQAVAGQGAPGQTDNTGAAAAGQAQPGQDLAGGAPQNMPASPSAGEPAQLPDLPPLPGNNAYDPSGPAMPVGSTPDPF